MQVRTGDEGVGQLTKGMGRRPLASTVMKLIDLAFACYIYSRMSDYDSSYRRLVEGTRPQLDLQLEKHRELLLKWLDEWRCRQFSKGSHELAGQEIVEWYTEIGPQLFSIDKALLSLTDDDFELVERAYASLVGRIASKRRLKKGGETRVAVGPTGTAKILFALRPNALIPWDDPIREELVLDGSAHSYSTYLRVAKDHLAELRYDCDKQGFSLADLPQVLGRPASSVAKLIDEYFWVTISRKCTAPTDGEIRRWATWR